MKTFQIIMFVLTGCYLMRNLHDDVCGRGAHKPYGYAGAGISVGATIIWFIIQWKAGAFSLLF